MEELKSAPLFEIPLNTPLLSKCFKVYDGDTCRFMLEIFGKDNVKAWKGRMLHINTAEMRTKCLIEKKMAKLAKVRAKELLDQKMVCIQCTGTDLYGRKLIKIQLPDKRMYHDVIIQENLAWPFEGTKKFQDIILNATDDIYCATCTKTEKSRKNCVMWRNLLTAYENSRLA
jgi:endonuclease YncB( thermonuclease family)